MTYRVKTTGASWIRGIQYADDLSLIAENRVHLQHMMYVLDSTCLKWGMTISAEKTEVLSVGGPSVNSLPFMLQGQPPQEVDSLSPTMEV